MKKLNMRKLKAKGFTMIELLIGIGFIAAASAIVYYTYNKVKATGDANTEGRHLDTLRAGIKNMYQNQVSYGDEGGNSAISETFANQARITPDAMRIPGDDTVIRNKFGGSVTIAPATLGSTGNSNNAFAITYNNVPGEVCVKLVTTAGSQFDQVEVGTTTVKSFGTQSLNPVSTAKACNADTGNGVTIIFKSL